MVAAVKVARAAGEQEDDTGSRLENGRSREQGRRGGPGAEHQSGGGIETGGSHPVLVLPYSDQRNEADLRGPIYVSSVSRD